MGLHPQRSRLLVAEGLAVVRLYPNRSAAPAAALWAVMPTAEGLSYRPASDGTVAASLLDGVLAQWIDDGYAEEEAPHGYRLSWPAVYAVIGNPDYSAQAPELGLPELLDWVPRLISRGSLSDQDFVVGIAGWLDGSGRSIDEVRLIGATASVRATRGLLPYASFRLLERVAAFAQRGDSERDERSQRLAWGELRALALEAGARLDDFLLRTVVLSPERLRIGLRKGGTGGPTLIEVIPGFESCPDGWLEQFDAFGQVRDRYDVLTPNGVVQVIVRPQVKAVLQQIKRMPGRRAAGARAEAFVANPFATLGEEAGNVIDPEAFEAERVRAGLVFDRFTAYVDRSAAPVEAGIVIESGVGEGVTSHRLAFNTHEAPDFIKQGRAALAGGRQLFAWNEYEFELRGDTEDQFAVLEAALEPVQAASPLLQAQAIYDLSIYSERIQGIGVEKPYASPYIARKDDGEGWFPSNLVRMIEIPPERPDAPPTYVPIDDKALEQLAAAVRRAEADGAGAVTVPGTRIEIPLADARDIVATFATAMEKAGVGELGPELQQKSERKLRKGLLIKPNITVTDYIEQRIEALTAPRAGFEPPQALRPEIRLKHHQVEGAAWLQHLFRMSPADCRGAVLADDMGLGKTLQLLTLIAWAHEQDANLPPALIVAPVALLENWRDEVGKFLKVGALPLLEVYGDTLGALRVPKAEVDEQLRADGFVRFLKPGWVGGAKVVLTTYETLRDLEFSFAAEKWSILVCDEAQKIKNPNALVTRAAKKQHARFRVACTGTPVENTLADLWCLFDFVQPGLLGALNEFGQRYRRPIEAETDEEKSRVQELRKLIDPQILRRLKSQVATDLPRKIEREDCKQLPLTPVQRTLYSQAIAQFGKRNDPNASTPFNNALGLLHYLRLVCTDPRPYGMSGFRAEPLGHYRTKAPKLDWLLGVLKEIRSRGEKALVFCEFKDIQRLLRHYIQEELGFAAEIVNGDTAASSKSDQSRQKRIQAFQSRPGFGVIILSPLAVGFGVNIQAANHVIHYTRTWNPAKEDQATDRAYRIGQEKDVHVYCPVVTAADFTTFDQKLDRLLELKRKLAEDMLNGSGDVGPSEFDIGGVAPPDAPGMQPHVLSFEDVLRMSARYFEAYVAVLWARQGYPRVTLTPQSGDGGVDVVAIRGREGCLIQCKTSHSSTRQLGWDAIKDVVTGEAGYRAQYPGIEFKKVCVATQAFNAGARAAAEANCVQLVDVTALEEMHEHQRLTREDIERLVWSSWRPYRELQ